MHRVLAVSLALVVTGCCSEPWDSYPEKTPPDRSCSTGSVHGNDVYIWDCVRGEHVVVSKYSSEMSCNNPRREAAPCGRPTKLEAELKLTPEMCAGARPGRGWR